MKHAKIKLGDTFGRWTVISRDLSSVGKATKWICRCSCSDNTVRSVGGHSLKVGTSTSCRCVLKSAARKDSLVGRKFGKLTVLYESDVRGRSRNIHWVVQCDCDPKGERLKILPSGVLRGEYTRSCGCAAKNGEVIRSPEKRAKANANRIRRYAEDEKFVLHTRTKALIRQTLKNRKAYRAEYRFKNLGYSIDELEIRLKSTVPNGFTWKDFLEGNLHIDHIRPIASFDFKSSEDPSFKEAWALSNLQLLTPQENREKRAHLNWVR